MMTERELIQRHQAALRAIDRYDERNAIHAVLAKTGPRTGTHPMATKIEPEVPRPMAMRLRPPLLDMDMEEAADYARERLAAEIAADPYLLATAIGDRDGADKTLISLCRALSAMYESDEPDAWEKVLAVCVAVQEIADDAARYEIEI